MGIRKRYCYTVECNCCGEILEAYAGNLIAITNEREDAERVAKEHKWQKIGKNTWNCPECIDSVSE